MAIPLLGTDYFTKPEPQGSINSTVMRIMAQAGAAVGERVEKAQTQLEARTMAPVITDGYAKAYQKIAAGDFSGFSDMASVKALAAANPLLASLSKDADTLGIHIANNVTQREILKEREKSQTELQNGRLQGQIDLLNQREKFSTERDNTKYDEQEAGRVDTENAAIQKRNEQRQSAFEQEKQLNPNTQMEPLEPLKQYTPRPARTTSDNPLPTGGGGRVSSSPGAPNGGVVTNPLGMIQRNNPDLNTLPAPDASIQSGEETPGRAILQKQIGQIRSEPDFATNKDKQSVSRELEKQLSEAGGYKSQDLVIEDVDREMADLQKKPKSPQNDRDIANLVDARQYALSQKGKEPWDAPDGDHNIDMHAFIQDNAAGGIMSRNGLVFEDLRTIKPEGGRISLTRSVDGKPFLLSKEDSNTFVNVAAKLATEKAGADPKSSVGETIPATQPAISANPRPAVVAGKKVDEIQFGNVRFQIGAPDDNEAMKMKQKVIKTPASETTYADPSFSDKQDAMTARTKFIESIGTMKTDPNAAAFVSDHLNDKGRGGVTFPPEGRTFAKDGKTLVSAQMYGIDEKGNPVPFNPNNDAAGKLINAGTVSGEFVKAYEDATKVMDTVKNKYGTKLVRDEQPEAAKQPWDRVEDPDIKKAILGVQADIKAGTITKEEGKRRILEAQAKKDELNLDPETVRKFGGLDALDKKDAEQKKAEAKSELPVLREKLKKVEAEIKGGRETTFLSLMAGFGGSYGTGANPNLTSGATPDTEMSTKRRKELMILHSNLAKKIKALE